MPKTVSFLLGESRINLLSFLNHARSDKALLHNKRRTRRVRRILDGGGSELLDGRKYIRVALVEALQESLAAKKGISQRSRCSHNHDNDAYDKEIAL